MKKLAMGLCLLGAALTAESAYAGLTYSSPVVIYGNTATGSIASARYSNDKTQYITCAATAGLLAYVSCSAQDSAGHFMSCGTPNPSFALLQAVYGINSTSAIYFQRDNYYQCIYIEVGQNSWNLH